MSKITEYGVFYAGYGATIVALQLSRIAAILMAGLLFLNDSAYGWVMAVLAVLCSASLSAQRQSSPSGDADNGKSGEEA